MINSSLNPRKGLSPATIGIAFAASALFILSFRLIVDTPYSTSNTSDLAAAVSVFRSAADAVKLGHAPPRTRSRIQSSTTPTAASSAGCGDGTRPEMMG